LIYINTNDGSIEEKCTKVVRICRVNKVERVRHSSKYKISFYQLIEYLLVYKVPFHLNSFYQFLSVSVMAVDPLTCQEAQISLESVRCFGTEGRKTFRPWSIGCQ
jgi:hypothetical protein